MLRPLPLWCSARQTSARWSSVVALGLLVAPVSAQWTRLSTGLPDAYAPTQLLHHGGATYLVMTAAPPLQSRLLRSTDEGDTWTTLTAFPTAAFNANRFFYAVGQELVTWAEKSGTVVLLRSSDDGATWTNRELTGVSVPWHSILAVGSAVLVGNGGALLRSTDGLTTFTRIPGAPAEVTTLLDAGQAILAQTSAGMLYRSTDGGTTWASFRVGLTGVGTLWHVDGTLYVKTSFSSLFASTDAGATWSEQTPTYAPTTWGGAYPTGTGAAWLLSNAPYGLFTTSDGGRTATSITQGLPTASNGLLCAVPFPSGATAYFAAVNNPGGSCTGGASGLYRYRPAGSVTAEASAGTAPMHLAVAPSPSRGPVAAVLIVGVPATVRVTVVDALGRDVAVLHEGPLGVGAHRFDWAAAAPAGVYVVRATASGGAVATQRFVRLL